MIVYSSREAAIGCGRQYDSNELMNPTLLILVLD